ncbi:hypothetical protein [Roseobacter sp. HKCCA0434]|uniref:hypothetical protein n=1 Tax=Roseobacter sp. HKCCA0434 TaxID=3079297 RepID=UPI002905DE90|nr:hypothetical protein [Roseobacter sp. HKCCA0434]
MRLHRTCLAGLALAAAPCAGAFAQTFTISGGLTADLEEIVWIENLEGGGTHAELRVTPNFDPEPFGPRPPADVVEPQQELCEIVWPQIAGEAGGMGITRLDVRWGWTPEQQDGPFTISRSHTNRFDVSDGTCQALEPRDRTLVTPRSGPEVRWLRSSAAQDRQLDGIGLNVFYRLPEPLSAYSDDQLDAMAQELCVTEATDIVARRHAGYDSIRYEWAAIAFEEQLAPNSTESRRFVWFLNEQYACEASLSESEIEEIRAAMR